MVDSPVIEQSKSRRQRFRNITAAKEKAVELTAEEKKAVAFEKKAAEDIIEWYGS